jgi:indole-3-glycerol phosphate synthase
VILDEILAETRADLERRKAELPSSALPERTADLVPGGFERALSDSGVSVIAEIKRASPSKGAIRPDLDPAAVARLYSEAGVAAISCLTEPRRFLGSLEDLADAKRNSRVPVLRKDFIVDQYQLDEAVAYGADAVLLIVAALTPEELGRLHHAALERGLDVLVEAHTSEEARVALAEGARILGANNRDLRTFEVDLGTTARIAEEVDRGGALLVAESGIASVADLRQVAGWHVDAVLVGEHLMRQADVREAAERLVEAGRWL